MNHWLFAVADFLSKPPGFWAMLGLMALSSLVLLLGADENFITFALSVLAIVVTGVVLIQGYRDTAAIHAKLDEIVIRLEGPRQEEVVGLEKREPREIEAKLDKLEAEAQVKPRAPRRRSLKRGS